MKKDFPETCCCTICWWIITYCTIPVEDRRPQLGWLQSSVPICFFKKNASSSTPLGTHGVRIKSLAIMMALILFPSFNFCFWCKARWLRSPKSIPHFQHFSGHLICTVVQLFEHLLQICGLDPSVRLHSPSLKNLSQVNSSQVKLFMGSIQYHRNLPLLISWHWYRPGRFPEVSEITLVALSRVKDIRNWSKLSSPHNAIIYFTVSRLTDLIHSKTCP